MIYRQPIEVLTAGQWARADEWQISQAQAPARRGAAIIDMAAQVFADRGFFGASTRDVADVLGIRPASYRAATAGPMSAHSQRTSVSADRAVAASTGSPAPTSASKIKVGAQEGEFRRDSDCRLAGTCSPRHAQRSRSLVWQGAKDNHG
jgi:hypothetical protein